MVSRISRALLTSIRTLHRSAVRRHNIEGDYIKTSMTFLGEEDEDYIHITAYSNMGFKLLNGPRIFGPCAIFPKSILHWNVSSVGDINEDSLTLFCILEPKIDILILGTGDDTKKFNYKLVKYLRSKGIGVEVLPTDLACTTFNFLNAERRPVAAGLIPPTYISMDNEMWASTDQEILNIKLDFSNNSGSPPANELAPMLEESRKKMKSLFGKGNSERKQEQEHMQKQAGKQTENDSDNKK
ncbi:hypothetical protein CHS0354_004858 [Potamilus streckersoni]|uniref:NADH dehydrogenase [ubiquinone] 1 alpha subcomplex assembly factor 3 n=1 Tax=Potamilus streckersoni TaxID=2493646 RepID=A0AAE0S9C1_9BIVA|nr:hypothetical protein CHS0354_004858 [Potamilus streckersoni]